MKELGLNNITKVTSRNIELKLISKLLPSGNCQVKFYAKMQNSRDLYGYTLVAPEATLKEVVKVIKIKLKQSARSDNYYHHHLYDLGAKQEERSNFMIFKHDAGSTQH